MKFEKDNFEEDNELSPLEEEDDAVDGDVVEVEEEELLITAEEPEGSMPVAKPPARSAAKPARKKASKPGKKKASKKPKKAAKKAKKKGARKPAKKAAKKRKRR
ncbi:MAG TPA: hypothetical protein VOA64_14940 [Candidatus Dormibacteraeota bacterium]|nr:hypothetical protein [Candidatus Dormibacteraeota bacterium]